MTLENGQTQDDETEHDISAPQRKAPDVKLDFEYQPENWQPHRISDCTTLGDCDDWELRPRRFVDGKDVGRTVAWLQTEPDGFPVPLRLSVVGAIAMHNDGGTLKRHWHDVQRVLTMATDCFDAQHIAEFAEALASSRDNIRLHPVPCPPEGLGFDFERTGGRTRSESRKQMNELEKQAMRAEPWVPTLVDGRLDAHNGGFDPELSPVLGLVKSHHVEYFAADANCWNCLYSLEPGQRTPAFIIKSKSASYDVVSWYLRMCGSNGEMPNWGIVRVEVTEPFFKGHCDFSAIDRWSKLICEYRCRDESYGRSAVSIHPIVRAEQSLGEVFTSLDTLAHRFYRLTGI